jgi:hypothetical protein
MEHTHGEPEGAPQPLDLRRGLQQLSRGLVIYGVIGIVMAAIAFGALIWVNGRIGGLRSEVETTIGQLATTTANTSDALRDASTTAKTFSSTLGQASDALPAMSTRIVTLQSGLGSLESTLRSVNILGAAPLGGAADSVANISASLNGIDTQLAIVATALKANSDALGTNATSLGTLADSTQALATRLGSGQVQDSLGDVQMVVVVVLLVFTLLSLVPAVGALIFGMWLRRGLEASQGATAAT